MEQLIYSLFKIIIQIDKTYDAGLCPKSYNFL